jgi:hypothetical protein
MTLVAYPEVKTTSLLLVVSILAVVRFPKLLFLQGRSEVLSF